MLPVQERIKTALQQQFPDTDIQLDIPDNPEHGDYSANTAMRSAGTDNPRELAQKAVKELKVEGIDGVADIQVAGPGFINFYLNKKPFAEEVIQTLEQDNLGVEQHDGKLLLEFSSPNVAKPMHAGHLRNNALGDALQRILRFIGYNVTSENYIGDWGTQYGKLIYAFKQFGSQEQFDNNPMEHMYQLYVTFHDELENNQELEEKGREWAQKIEQGDKEARKLWNMFRDASIQHHKKDYERMGVHFDRWTGESTVVEESKRVLQIGVDNGVIQEDDDGSLFIKFNDLPSAVIQKADGSTLYLSRDLANLKKRVNEGFHHNLYVVGSEQDLHFKQVFKSAEKFGIKNHGGEHISYGLLSLPEGSMSSRKGKIIRLSDVLDQAVEKAEEKIADRDVDSAEEIGIGAVKYANLAVSRNKAIQFNWEQVLSFEGNSGPYLQYSNTRAKSILGKADHTGSIESEPGEEEHRLVKKLSEFPRILNLSADRREPAYLANYLTELCEEFNSFYHSLPVLDAEENIRQTRLQLVDLFVQVTDTGLQLLGIHPLEEM